MVSKSKEKMEAIDSYRKDSPIQKLYEALAKEALEEVLKRPHSKSLWRYNTRPPLRFRASEAGSCARKIWYRLMGFVPAPDSPDLKLQQMAGNLGQDVLRALLINYKIPLEGVTVNSDFSQKETTEAITPFSVNLGEISTTVKVSGRSDGFLPDLTALMEFKTMSHWKAYWLQQAYDGNVANSPRGPKGARKRIDEKYSYYDAQMQITMAIFGRDQMYFVPYNRSDCTYGLLNPDGTRQGILIKRDEAKVQQILRKFADIKLAVNAESPPPPKPDGDMECSFCPFYYACHKAIKTGKLVYPYEEGV